MEGALTLAGLERCRRDAMTPAPPANDAVHGPAARTRARRGRSRSGAG